MLTFQSVAMSIWTSHMLSSTTKKKVKPNTFCLQLYILLKYYSVQNLHHNSKTIHHIWTLSDTDSTTGKPFSIQPSPRFCSIPELIWKVSSLLISCSLLALHDRYAAWQWTGLSRMHSSASNSAFPLAGLHHLLTQGELLSRGFTGNHLTCSGDIHRQHF